MKSTCINYAWEDEVEVSEVKNDRFVLAKSILALFVPIFVLLFLVVRGSFEFAFKKIAELAKPSAQRKDTATELSFRQNA